MPVLRTGREACCLLSQCAASYTWVTANGGEFLAIALASLLSAAFLASTTRQDRKGRKAWLVPFVAFGVLVAYNFLVGWSFDWDLDLFIGDALIGAMIFNGIFFAGTLIFGSLTAPSVWVSLIATTNVALLMIWRTRKPQKAPTA